MSWKFLKVQTFVVIATLSIAMLLFAAQRHDSGAGPQFRSVVDLTASSGSAVDLSGSRNTVLIAPAKLGGAWTLDSLPTTRLIAPVAVIEAQKKNFPDSESLVTMDDVAAYERTNGAVPAGAIVLLTSAKGNVSPLLSSDALRFLGQARNIVGFGSAAAQALSSGDDSYVAKKGIYQLANLSNVSLIPGSGGIAIAAPQKIAGATEGPVRVMVLVR